MGVCEHSLGRIATALDAVATQGMLVLRGETDVGTAMASRRPSADRYPLCPADSTYAVPQMCHKALAPRTGPGRRGRILGV